MTEREMKRKARARKARNRRIAVVVSLVLVIGLAAIGGTIAWLQDKTETVTNTFTPSDINIELTETKSDFKMVPGSTIEKDPQVTVKAGSEKCWVFVKIEESTSPKLDEYISYDIADGWTELSGVSGVYYRIQEATTADVSYSVLANDSVTVKDSVTKGMMEAIDGKDGSGNATTEAQPTLSFTAYAIQYSSFEPAATEEGATSEVIAAAEQTAAQAAWNQAKTTV